MKKYLKLALYSLFAITMFTAWGCSDDDDDKDVPVKDSQLPAKAKAFISTYFGDDGIVRINKEREHDDMSFDVWLQSGTRIEFDGGGEWEDVEVPQGKGVPEGICPLPMVTYLHENYPGVAMREISLEPSYYEVDLFNGVELIFDLTGKFISAGR